MTGALGVEVIISSYIVVTSRADLTTRPLSAGILTELFSTFVLIIGSVIGANVVSYVVIVTALAQFPEQEFQSEKFLYLTKLGSRT